jgi:predicted DNA-binding protein with PD1-like motif
MATPSRHVDGGFGRPAPVRPLPLTQAASERRFVLAYRAGDDVLRELLHFARDAGIEGATFTGLGALQEGAIAWWNPSTRRYEERPFRDQREVASLVGNVSLSPAGDDVEAHAHAVLGDRDGRAHAGHLLRGIVRPTLEVALVESASPLRRVRDEATGLSLLA